MGTESLHTFTNQALSKRLGINLPKWKRWAREFLPPDPSAGMRSGNARKYVLGQVFEVHLGGILVGTLKYSIPEAKQILADLIPWAKTNSLYPGATGNEASIPAYQIFIWPTIEPPGRFRYIARKVIRHRKLSADEGNAEQLTFMDDPILLPGLELVRYDNYDYRILEVSQIRAIFDLTIAGQI